MLFDIHLSERQQQTVNFMLLKAYLETFHEILKWYECASYECATENNFLISQQKTYVVGPQKNLFNEMVLLST